MKTVPDVEIAVWLERLPLPPDGMDWDDGNETKNEKHGVGKADIESILHRGGFYFAGRIVSPVHREWRGLILGEDRFGRDLALIFTIRHERLRTISCRPMRRAERMKYAQEKKDGAARPRS